VEVELGEELQNAVLSYPLAAPDGTLTTVGALLGQARAALALANETLRGSSIVQVAASHIMQHEKRRGNPTIQVNLEGKAVLRVTYEPDAPRPAPPVAPKSKLPRLEALRERAAQLGVDVSHLGRNKHKILALLGQEEEQRRAAPPS
jgi:hypothetical protein